MLLCVAAAAAFELLLRILLAEGGERRTRIGHSASFSVDRYPKLSGAFSPIPRFAPRDDRSTRILPMRHKRGEAISPLESKQMTPTLKIALH